MRLNEVEKKVILRKWDYLKNAKKMASICSWNVLVKSVMIVSELKNITKSLQKYVNFLYETKSSTKVLTRLPKKTYISV